MSENGHDRVRKEHVTPCGRLRLTRVDCVHDDSMDGEAWLDSAKVREP